MEARATIDYSESEIAQGKLILQLPGMSLTQFKLSSIDDVNCNVLTNPEAEFMNVQFR
jgi:hypothetical protein